MDRRERRVLAQHQARHAHPETSVGDEAKRRLVRCERAGCASDRLKIALGEDSHRLGGREQDGPHPVAPRDVAHAAFGDVALVRREPLRERDRLVVARLRDRDDADGRSDIDERGDPLPGVERDDDQDRDPEFRAGTGKRRRRIPGRSDDERPARAARVRSRPPAL
jgi:hypothetical protein